MRDRCSRLHCSNGAPGVVVLATRLRPVLPQRVAGRATGTVAALGSDPRVRLRGLRLARDDASGAVLATRHVRVLPTTTPFRNSLPRGSGAPRGASNQCRATPTHVAMSRRFGRGARRRQVYAVCATHLLPGRARLPALCCGSRQGFDPLTQLQAMLPGTRGKAGVTRPLLSQSRDSTSRRGLGAAGRDAQSRPGAECIGPRAGTAPAPSFESALAKGALSGQGEHP